MEAQVAVLGEVALPAAAAASGDGKSTVADGREAARAEVEAEVGAVAPQELGGREASEVTAVTAV